MNAKQQAAVQDASNALQASGMNATQALQAAIANQNASLTVGTQNLNASQQTQGLNANLSAQAQLANMNATQQASVQNAANALQASGMNATNAMNAAIANQNSTNANNQLKTTQAGQAAQYGLASDQLNTQNAQFGAQYGLNALNAGVQAYTGQANIANQGFANQIAGINVQNTLGQQAQQTQQNVDTAAYNEWLNQRNYPMALTTGALSALQGTGTSSTSNLYSAGPTTAQNLIGASAGIMAGNSILNPPAKTSAGGGLIKPSRTSGLLELALAKMH